MSKIETPVNQRMRALMPVAKKLAYFDHAAVSPISQPAYEAITTWLSQASSQGDLCWPEWAKQVEVHLAAAAECTVGTTGVRCLQYRRLGGVQS